MPSRRVLPKLSIFSRHSAPLPSTPSPSSATQSSFPLLTPPARLHLRNILPSSPDGMPTPPPPPRRPYAWLWQCHSCNTIYRIGCTRRCLVCSHEYCVSANPPKAGRGRKRRRASGMCASEFDYSGWAEWGAWRRKVLGLEVAGRTREEHREKAFAARTHNCVLDCDYPSECHHERYRLHTEALERKLHKYLEPLEDPESPPIVASRPSSPDDDLLLNEALELRETDIDGDEKETSTSPKSPLSQTSFFWDEPDPEEEDEKAWWVDSERQEKKRKIKSHQKVQQLTGIGTDDLDEVSLSKVDDGDVELEAEYSHSHEEEDTVSLDVANATPGRQCSSRVSNREHPKYSKKLSVCNVTEGDERKDWDDWSDSDSDGSSSLSSPSSSSSLDGEWLPGNEDTLVSQECGICTDSKTEEEIGKELDGLVKAGKSFLQD